MRGALISTSFLSAFCALVSADGIYTKNSPVLQVSSKDFDSLIEQSNHTSIVEFYAPWCGHCQNLKPAYEKAAKNLAGLAKVAAINCDEEDNKPLCARMGIKGFPTLKIVKPGSMKGRPVIEDYQGARTAKGIVDAVITKIPNHVKKVQDSVLDAWLEEGGQAKAILFTEKGTTAPLIKALAVDFLGSVSFATIRNKEKAAIAKYGVTKFPTFVLIPGVGKEAITYNGEMKKESLVDFFAQVASPNPDPAPKKSKAKSTKKAKPTADDSASAEFSKAPKSQKSSEFDEHMQAKTIELQDEAPTASPLPIVEQDEKPLVIKEAAAPLPQLATPDELQSACLASKSGTCVLILLPTNEVAEEIHPLAAEALASFAEVAEKHTKRQTKIFPFYGVPASNEGGNAIRDKLELKPNSDLEVLAINMKRKWWRQFSSSRYDITDAEDFVDAIRLGEGAKQKLPDGFGSGQTAASEATAAPKLDTEQDETEEPAVPKAEAEPAAENTETGDPLAVVPEPASTAEVPVHNEL